MYKCEWRVKKMQVSGQCKLNRLRAKYLVLCRQKAKVLALVETYLMITPILRWCLVDLRGHFTDGKTILLPPVSSLWLVSCIFNPRFVV